MTFLPYDRTGNRRFAPVEVNAEEAEVLIYEDEDASRNYIDHAYLSYELRSNIIILVERPNDP